MEFEELKSLEIDLIPRPWEIKWKGTLGWGYIDAPGLRIEIGRQHYGNVPPEARFISVMRNLAPELLALWEVKNEGCALDSAIALEALNQKLQSL